MIKIFRKKPIQIEAIKWTGKNRASVEKFLDGHGRVQSRFVLIYTTEGTRNAAIGDWIVKGVKGEFYPCTADIMELIYEEV